jgi:hypothetical protein
MADGRLRLRLTLRNTVPSEPLAHLFVVRVGPSGAAFTHLPLLEQHAVLDLDLPVGTASECARRLGERLTAALVEAGLFRDEAVAMVRTWEDSWFGLGGGRPRDAIRVLYLLPPPLVERELPLQVRDLDRQAEPWRVTRVFVGRTELLSPAREAEVDAAVQAIARGASAETLVATWGRFAEPYVRRALALAPDAIARRAAEDALAALRLVR